MKHIYQQIVVLLNDLESIDTLLEKAMDFAKRHQTVLEIVYVHEEPLFDIPDYFLSDEDITNNHIDKEKIKRRIQTHLDNFEIQNKIAILVYIDDTVDRLLTILKDRKETLIVSSYHKILSPLLIKKTPYSYWFIKNNLNHYKKIILPLDLHEKSKKSIQIAQHLFTQSHLEILHDYRYLLDVLSVREDYLNVVPLTLDIDLVQNKAIEQEQKNIFESYKNEFNIDGTFMEGSRSIGDDLIDYIKKKSYDLTLLHRQDEVLFLSPSLITLLMKELSTDFFII